MIPGDRDFDSLASVTSGVGPFAAAADLVLSSALFEAADAGQ